ncbi:hypothetical protein GGI17_003808 [Coemansia sp. S146]|nr:hypothetical protein GGI17_003808 [Coemansia sp. S146]
MSTLHTQYSSSQTAATTAGSNSGPSGTGLDPSSHDSGAMANSPASRDAAATVAAVAAAAVASNGGVLSAADYSRGYNAMSPVGHGQMLPPPSQYLAQHQQQQQQHSHHQHQTQQHQQQHGHQQQQHHHQHHHSLPSIDMNGHAAAAAAVAGYQSSYGLADSTGAGAGGMVSLMSSPTATSWGHGPGSPLSPHSSVSAVAAAAAAAAAANQQHQSNGSWYGSMYQQPQYSPAGHGMVMYHDSYATSPTAAAAAAASYYPPRARLTTTLWEDEQTLVYQVDCRGICVARRHDDNMINGTKLLNVVGMSRGKRDGILKNEKGRRVVKVGPMHLKGVWIPFERARFLAEQFKVVDVLFPIFQPDPNSYLYGTIPITSPTTAAGLPASADPYSAAAAAVAANSTGYSQLARGAQDAYDASMAAAAAVSVNTPTTASSSTASHSHSASLSQAMAANSAAQMHHHHHHHSSSSVSQGNGSGLGISYISSPTRLTGVPSSPQSLAALAGGSSTSLSSAATGGPVSPTANYMSSKDARYTPYGTSTTGFQSSAMGTGGSKQSALGSKRGSIDHHYHQLHTPSSAAAAAAVSSAQQHSSLTSALAKHHHHDALMAAASGADQDNGLTMAQGGAGGSSSQQQQQPSYFDSLLVKGEQ